MRMSFTLALAGALLLAGAGMAVAGLEVTRSTAPGIKVGAKFNDEAIFEVPAGGEIELLKTPQNTTHKIAGPYTGTLAKFATACPWWKAVVGSCKASGDTKEGGTRGVRIGE